MRHRRRPAKARRAYAVLAGAFAAALVAAVLLGPRFAAPAANDQAFGAPVGLSVPAGLSTDDLHAWCKGRLAAGTANLNAADVGWLRSCVRVSAPIPTTSPTPSPSSTGTPSAPATTPPTSSPSTPSSSPAQPPAGSVNGCLAAPSACGLPDATNTGAKGTLATVNGDVTLSTAGMVYSNKLVNGCLHVAASNVTVKNVKIVCHGLFGLSFGNGTTGGVAQDVTVQGDRTPDSYIGVIGAGAFTIQRADISGYENGFDIQGNDTIVDSYIHDLKNGSGDHTDGAQFEQGGGNVTFRHNTIRSDQGNSAIIMWDESNPQNFNVTIDGNLLQGGSYTLYCPRQNASNVVVTGNRFSPGAYGATNSCVAGHVASFSGNVYDDSGKPVSAA